MKLYFSVTQVPLRDRSHFKLQQQWVYGIFLFVLSLLRYDILRAYTFTHNFTFSKSLLISSLTPTDWYNYHLTAIIYFILYLCDVFSDSVCVLSCVLCFTAALFTADILSKQQSTAVHNNSHDGSIQLLLQWASNRELELTHLNTMQPTLYVMWLNPPVHFLLWQVKLSDVSLCDIIDESTDYFHD